MRKEKADEVIRQFKTLTNDEQFAALLALEPSGENLILSKASELILTICRVIYSYNTFFDWTDSYLWHFRPNAEADFCDMVQFFFLCDDLIGTNVRLRELVQLAQPEFEPGPVDAAIPRDLKEDAKIYRDKQTLSWTEMKEKYGYSPETLRSTHRRVKDFVEHLESTLAKSGPDLNKLSAHLHQLFKLANDPSVQIE